VRREVETEARRLLRLLQLWICGVSVEAEGVAGLLKGGF
jgi:hypothetical protein